MEIRMQPRSDLLQRCHNFSLNLKPSARVFGFQDYNGNSVQHFDIPTKHSYLEIETKSIVEVFPTKDLPDALSFEAWKEIDTLTFHPDFWEFTQPSHFAKPTESLLSLSRELNATRDQDPLTVLKNLNTSLNQAFEYLPEITSVDSPIDEAIEHKSGVCQDFSNIMIALVRELKIPCRYVSGYLFHRADDRSHIAQDATHAWVEAYLPSLGWVGFDPTNNLIVEERHIRVAIGRDYSDVPPTCGVYKGNTDSELSVAVRVATVDSKEIETVTKEFTRAVSFQTSFRQKQIQEEQQQQQQ